MVQTFACYTPRGHGLQRATDKAIPHPKPGNPDYAAVNYAYAEREGHIHEVVEIGGRSLAKVGFADRKIVYYFLDDLELDEKAQRGTFHDADVRRSSSDA